MINFAPFVSFLTRPILLAIMGNSHSEEKKEVQIEEKSTGFHLLEIHLPSVGTMSAVFLLLVVLSIGLAYAYVRCRKAMKKGAMRTVEETNRCIADQASKSAGQSTPLLPLTVQDAVMQRLQSSALSNMLQPQQQPSAPAAQQPIIIQQPSAPRTSSSRAVTYVPDI